MRSLGMDYKFWARVDPMRLIVATNFLTTKGGLERVVLKIAEHFDARVHCVHYNPETTYDGFKKLHVESMKGGFLTKLPLERRLTASLEAGNYFSNLKLEDFDLINAQQSPSEWIRQKNSPVLWYCTSPTRAAFDLYDMHMKRRNPLSKALFWASVQTFRRTEFKVVPKIESILSISRTTQARVKKYLHRDSEILPPGVEAEKFSCKSYENFFFYPSRIVPEKRMEYAIEAFKLFSSRFPGWKLVIAGSLSDRPEHSSYLKKLRSISTPAVTIETNVSEEGLLDMYSRCSAVLFAPIDEDFGLVPLEGMASSKPCISVNEGGPRETISDGKDGFLVNSIWEMSEKMAWLAKRPDECAKMGRAGRKKVEEEYTWERFLHRFEDEAKKTIAQANEKRR
jgi:glycosyltransferase involved in cell wall biosynthesis